MPCSASAVVEDVKTGDVVALVSYPGYDNNRLTNDIDTDYYAKLALDQSSPFFNKATQQTTADAEHGINASCAGSISRVYILLIMKS